jgi:hypothetical protein
MEALLLIGLLYFGFCVSDDTQEEVVEVAETVEDVAIATRPISKDAVNVSEVMALAEVLEAMADLQKEGEN